VTTDTDIMQQFSVTVVKVGSLYTHHCVIVSKIMQTLPTKLHCDNNIPKLVIFGTRLQ